MDDSIVAMVRPRLSRPDVGEKRAQKPGRASINRCAELGERGEP